MWLKRLLYGEKTMGLKQYFDYTFKTVGGRFIFICNYDTKLIKFKAPLFYFEILRAWQDMEKSRNYVEGKINPIFFNIKDYLCKGRIIYHEDLYLKNIYLVEQILEKDHNIRAVTYFHNFVLGSGIIITIWKICDAIFKSGKYKRDTFLLC